MSTPKWKKLARQESLKKEAFLKHRKNELFNLNIKKTFIEYEPKKSTFVRQTKEYPSFSSTTDETELFKNGTGKQEPKQYTGEYIVGIATMHKSNLVPITKDCNPKDYSTMRRN